MSDKVLYGIVMVSILVFSFAKMYYDDPETFKMMYSSDITASKGTRDGARMATEAARLLYLEDWLDSEDKDDLLKSITYLENLKNSPDVTNSSLKKVVKALNEKCKGLAERRPNPVINKTQKSTPSIRESPPLKEIIGDL